MSKLKIYYTDYRILRQNYNSLVNIRSSSLCPSTRRRLGFDPNVIALTNNQKSADSIATNKAMAQSSNNPEESSLFYFSVLLSNYPFSSPVRGTSCNLLTNTVAVNLTGTATILSYLLQVFHTHNSDVQVWKNNSSWSTLPKTKYSA